MTIRNDVHGQIVQASRPYSSQTIAIGAGSIASAAFSVMTPQGSYSPSGVPAEVAKNNTTHVRVVATSNCWISFGAAPTAVASGTASIYLPLATPEYFFVNAGEKIAVIQDSGAGLLNIAELVS